MLKQAKIAIEECEEDISVSEKIKIVPSFKKMNLKTELLHGIYEYGFEKPSLVQQRAISQIIEGRDVVVQAQSGTGKTATFCIGSLQRIDCSQKATQALFLAPTRELASQIHQVITALADYLSVSCVLCCGGKNTVGEMSGSLGQFGSQIVVGTPGRILDMLRHGCLKLSHLRVFVVDEADEMLNQGLREQLEQILKRLPSSSSSGSSSNIFDVDDLTTLSTGSVVKSPVQRIVVSATWTSGCREMMTQFLDNPVRILVPRDELSLSGIAQFYIDVDGEEWKFETLTDIFASICVPQTVVFANTRHKVDWLMDRLREDGFAVTAAHGDMDQTTRDNVMKQFRAGRSRILVTTDIWARGIDVQSVGLVVNYDLPITSAVYLHRIGRSGRFGRRGLAISLVADKGTDKAHLINIAKTYSIAILPAPATLSQLTGVETSAVAPTRTSDEASAVAPLKTGDEALAVAVSKNSMKLSFKNVVKPGVKKEEMKEGDVEYTSVGPSKSKKRKLREKKKKKDKQRKKAKRVAAEP